MTENLLRVILLHLLVPFFYLVPGSLLCLFLSFSTYVVLHSSTCCRLRLLVRNRTRLVGGYLADYVMVTWFGFVIGPADGYTLGYLMVPVDRFVIFFVFFWPALGHGRTGIRHHAPDREPEGIYSASFSDFLSDLLSVPLSRASCPLCYPSLPLVFWTPILLVFCLAFLASFSLVVGAVFSLRIYLPSVSYHISDLTSVFRYVLRVGE